ncbi:MAG: PilZ domain-containing protein [Candidatus Brocadiales bacterium]
MFNPERREHKRLDLLAQMETSLGKYYTMNISPGGACVIGPPDIKEKLHLNETIEFDIRIRSDLLLSMEAFVHCRGDVIWIGNPSPYLTKVGLRFHEVPVVDWDTLYANLPITH